MAELRHQSIRLSDGTRLAYREAGTGTPMIFLHGWSLDGSVFAAQLDGLAQQFRVICPDLRGHGATSFDAAITVDRLAADIDELIGALALRDVIAVGWSLGAMVWWRMLTSGKARRLAGLITVDMSPMIHNLDGWDLGLADGRDHAAASGSAQAMVTDWQRMVCQFVPRIFSTRFATENPELIARYAAIAERNNVHGLATLWRSMVDQDYRDRLHDISVPTLIAYGRHSRLYRAETAHFIAARMPQAALFEFTRSGHAPHIEEPARFNAMTEAFARGVSMTEGRHQAQSVTI